MATMPSSTAASARRPFSPARRRRRTTSSRPNKTYYEIPIAIQDRSFNDDGSLFYPDTRAFFDEFAGPYIPESNVSPIWNPEFFGNTIIANGNTWPYQTVERRRYRLRFLNGCQSRFLILDFSDIPGVEVWQIGNEGGFLAAPVNLTADNGNRLLMGLAERADLIVDFTNVPVGPHVLRNVGPDEPFGGGVPGVDFDPAHDDSTGQILEFRVVPATAVDPTTPPQFLVLPAIAPLPAETRSRPLALIELESDVHDGPSEAVLGSVEGGTAVHRHWADDVTENPGLGDTEVWEFYNVTADAHPMHVHEVAFEVVNRQAIEFDEEGHTNIHPVGDPRGPEPWESGFKDTVIAYPGEVTRLRLKFDERRPVRLALPHRRARGQRDDAAVSDRSGAARTAYLTSVGRRDEGQRPQSFRRGLRPSDEAMPATWRAWVLAPAQSSC